MNLVLYKGNNYYNRRIIRAKSDYEYTTKYGFWEVGAATLSAFILNDGVRTSQIINYDHESNGFGDYAVAYDNKGRIDSRWWVLNTTVIRNGQVKVELLRDVIADWYDDIIISSSFIRKGNITSTSSTAIFNNENMSYNQIKKSEKFIKDKTGSGWYVGYLSKDLGSKTVNIPGSPVNANGSYLTEDDYPYSRYTPENPYVGDYTDITYIVYGYLYDTKTYAFGWNDAGEAKDPTLDGWGKGLVGGIPGRVETELPLKGYLIQGMGGNNVYDVWDHTSGIDWRNASYAATGVHTDIQTANFYNSENGRVILVGGVPKRVIVSQVTYSNIVNLSNSSTFTNLVKTNVVDKVDWLGTNSEYTTSSPVSIAYTSIAYSVRLEDVDETSYSFTIPDTRRHTEGVPYDIFAIPAGTIFRDGGSKTSSPSLSKKLVAAITTDLVSGGGSTQLYDVQYVPYCPLADDYLYHLGIDTRALTNNADYSLVSLTNDWTIVIYATTNNFNKIISDNPISVPTDATNFKIANETEFYRLCSPNYNGQFEFSATQNGGVSEWNITYSYKPFTPYIKVAPKFGRLYGTDFGDARGLVCGGDFSLPQTNDAWAEYELQNKNYQVMFDRQITNMKVNNAVQREMESWQVLTGTVGGGVSGAMAGSMTPGGGYAAAGGAALGSLTSLAAGIADINLNEKLRREALSYAQDQYSAQLKNIEALPYSLTKVGSQNADYKIWPFVEKYGCTIEEAEALRSKLIWNGFTVDRIGLINVYKRPLPDNIVGVFVQAKIIKLEGTTADNRIAEVINSELQTGVYFVE